MAKSRKTSRTTRSRTRKASRRPARARTRKAPRRQARPRPGRVKKVELRPVRRQLEAHTKSLRGAEQSRKVKDALRRLNRCLAELKAICGPDMSIPIG